MAFDLFIYIFFMASNIVKLSLSIKPHFFTFYLFVFYLAVLFFFAWLFADLEERRNINPNDGQIFHHCKIVFPQQFHMSELQFRGLM